MIPGSTQGVVLTPIEGLKIQGNFSYNLFDVDYQDVQSKVEIVSDRPERREPHQQRL